MKELEGEDKKRKIFYPPNSIREVEHRLNFNWIIGSKTQTAEGLGIPSTTEKPNSSALGLVSGKEQNIHSGSVSRFSLAKRLLKGSRELLISNTSIKYMPN